MDTMKISRLLLLPAAAAALIAAGCGGGGPSVPADSVAVVDGVSITKATLDDLMARAKITYKQQGRDFPKVGTAEYQGLQQQALAFLVKRQQNELEAKELGVAVTDKDVDKSIAEIRKTQFKDDQKALDKQIKAAGYTLATLRAELRANLVTEGLFKAVTKDVKVGDAAVKKYYDENKATYSTPESRDVRHILVAKKPLAERIRKELVGGADFAALAKRYSTDPGSKNTGGKYTVAKGQMVPPFEKASFSLKTNEISQPIKTEFGWHIIQATSDLKKAVVTPFPKVKEQIRTQLLETDRSETMTKWDEGLTDKYTSKVAYADGFAPPELATAPVATADES
ncbi:MAG: hypothetical protein FJW96_04645 [Actinobacteria bacterium]|nr:hypothetical protein [Actinomycetota bacterium]